MDTITTLERYFNLKEKRRGTVLSSSFFFHNEYCVRYQIVPQVRATHISLNSRAIATTLVECSLH